MSDFKRPQDDVLNRRAIAIKSQSPGVSALDPNSPPIITAKGKGYVAERILDMAFADGIKVRKDTDLTNLLDAFDVDCPVPLEALHTVGLILQRVYEENEKAARNVGQRKDTVASHSSPVDTGEAPVDSTTATGTLVDAMDQPDPSKMIDITPDTTNGKT